MDFSQSLEKFSGRAPDLFRELMRKPNLLEGITQLALDPQNTDVLLAHFKPIFADVCARWRSSPSHWAILGAFGRVLPFVPHLAEHAEIFLQQAGDLSQKPPDFSAIGEIEAREYLLGTFRLILFDNATFGRYVHASTIQGFLSHPSKHVRYLAIRSLCLYVRAADAALENIISKHFGDEPIPGLYEGKQINYRHFGLWEEQRHADIRKSLIDHDNILKLQDPPEAFMEAMITREDLCPLTAEVHGLLLPKLPGAGEETPDSTRLHMTRTTTQNVRSFADCLLRSDPILLTGLSGSGKTLVVKHLARKLNKLRSMITLHLNEQSDAKLLIGMHTSGSTPGTFTWKAGVLTTAVKEGRWVLIEDLDRAPNEIISTLLPLIERRELLIPARGERIKAARGFRIIGTIRTTINSRGEESRTELHSVGSRFWQHVQVSTPSISELQEITLALFPCLSQHVPQVIATYSHLLHTFNQPSFGAENKTGTLKMLSPRDLFKWCRRIKNIVKERDVYTDDQRDKIFLEAVDCFAGNFQSGNARDLIISSSAEEFHIDPKRRDLLLKTLLPTRTITKEVLRIGRAEIQRSRIPRHFIGPNAPPFAENGHTMRLLERVAVAIQHKEPVLMVGETGTGKTTVIQHLAQQSGQRLHAFNLSQQSESGDMLGGYKPVTIQSLVVPLKDTFDDLFRSSFSLKKNQKYLDTLSKCLAKGQWNRVCILWKEALRMVESQTKQSVASVQTDPPKKRQKVDAITEKTRAQWRHFATELTLLERQISAGSNAFAFSFVEGNIVKAVRNGDWVLLDEVNLATSETLDALADLFGGEAESPFIMLTEKGDAGRIEAHPDFRIFAAMNPATDIGKKELPPGIRSRFTELFVESPDQDTNSLQAIVDAYLGSDTSVNTVLLAKIASLYQEIQSLSNKNRLVDGADQKPHYSLRTLTRTLAFARDVAPLWGIYRALYEGFHMSFCTVLNKDSNNLVSPHIAGVFPKKANLRAELKKPLKRPVDGREYVQESSYWLRRGKFDIEQQRHYIITPFVRQNLDNLVRATLTRRLPVLLQGPTSSGKTSMIEYLAKKSGNKFVRINNHEHTDLQEYLGTYVSDANGRLYFQEGVLVQALREGHWIVLDELNLAPTDVLEALNRLLDDNRELFIPETQEIIRPHEDFMLFATQNPVGLYGGRKALSRAFRNRFLELHFDDIPVNELNEILQQRTQIPPSWSTHIVDVYKELSVLRQENRLFESKSFATLRDLFRWALRSPTTKEEFAAHGYMLLAERVRKPDEREAIKDVIERVVNKRGPKIRINEDDLYAIKKSPEIRHYQRQTGSERFAVVWTKAMRRLFILLTHAVRNNEPVLLIGETGCGKTTVCQMLADAFEKHLFTVNAHQNTETGDLIGAQRPLRNRAILESHLHTDLTTALSVLGCHEATSDKSLDAMLVLYDQLSSKQDIEVLPEALQSRIRTNRRKANALFEWADGSLVEAMKTGNLFLLDEISLADDAVLERLNSVLEPQRTLLLAEKGPVDSLIVASKGFQFMATMNPGGDYGKRELSAALRNRFTEIWVPSFSDTEDMLQIVDAKLLQPAKEFAPTLVQFAQWFTSRYRSSSASLISLRDMLAWVDFINLIGASNQIFGIVHGAAMVYVDTLGANPSGLLIGSSGSLTKEKHACLDKLGALLGSDLSDFYKISIDIRIEESKVQIGPFSVPLAGQPEPDTGFTLLAPTTKSNAMRIFRALQSPKPILIEGNPGVGKTTLIAALAKFVGKPLTRINLSEQTDLMDLFGSDVPADGAAVGTFAWRDAPFLRAMKRGDWVLLDEMNLASQSVLEGLNACLDHRGEVYISELDQTFRRHSDFRLFAAQNPHHQGSGRKGLPASFVNRFTVVYADPLIHEDLMTICRHAFPGVSVEDLRRITFFVNELDTQVVQHRRFGTQGGPWEFNLRDTLRWLQLITSNESLLGAGGPFEFLDTLFVLRFRNSSDRESVHKIFSSCFPNANLYRNYYHNLSPSTCQVGLGLMARRVDIDNTPTDWHAALLPLQLPIMESLMICVQRNWPVILSGSTGTGKTNLLKRLAASVGTDPLIFSMSADIDAMDLVGAYEQVDPLRPFHRIVASVETFARNLLVQQLSEPMDSRSEHSVTRLLEALRYLSASAWTSEKIIQLRKEVYNLVNPNLAASVTSFLTQLDRAAHAPLHVDKARFAWVDGILVQAMEQGRWLVFDNANLCSSSVLDRLNPLLEPNGVLLVNEHPGKDGEPRIVKPHPDFRVFFTVDPRYGELSRAMRNRAVELNIASHSETSRASQSCLFPFESSLYRFRNYLKTTGQSRNDEQERKLIKTIALDHLSLSDDSEFSTSGASRSRSGGQSPDFLLTQSIVPHPDYSESISTFYNQVSAPIALFPSSDAQTIMPINNEALVRRSDSVKRATFLFSIYDLLRNLSDMESALNRALSADAGLPTTSRLFRSIAASRIPGAFQDSTYGIYKVLLDIHQITKTGVLRMLKNHSIQQANVQWIKVVLRFWWNIFEMLSVEDFDEPRYQALLKVGKSKITSASQAECDGDLLETARASMDKLEGFLALSTGRAIEPLWRLFESPQRVASHKALQTLLRLENLADTFDKTCMMSTRTSLLETARIRDSFADAMRLLFGSHAVNFDTLPNSLDDFADPRSGPSADTIEPFFSSEFEAICQIHDINGEASQTISAVLAQRTTKSAAKSKSLSKLASLNSYLGYCRTGPPIAFALREDLSYSLIEKISLHISEVSLKGSEMLEYEANYLGQLLARDTPLLCRNTVSPLDELLASLFQTVLRALRAPQEIDIHAFARRTAGESQDLFRNDVHCRDIFNNQFQDVFAYFSSATHPNRTEAASNAWTQFGIGCLLLFVPDKPYDPALGPIVEKEIWQKNTRDLEKQINALCTFEREFAGTSTSMRIRLLEEEHALQGAAPSVPAIVRPTRSAFTNLFGDFTNVLDLVNSLLRNGIGAGLEPALQQNLSQLIRRLSEHRLYDDLAEPVVGFLQCLQVGSLLGEQRSKLSLEGSHHAAPLLMMTPFLTGTPDRVSALFQRAEINDFSVCTHALEVLAVHRSIQGQLPVEYQIAMSRCLNLLFRDWKSNLQVDKEKAAAKSSLYRYRGGDEENESFDQEEFDELFPNHEISSNSGSALSTSYDPKVMARELTDIHEALFMGSANHSLGLESLLMKTPRRLSNVFVGSKAVSMANALPTVFLTLSSQKDTLRSDGAVGKSNFYTTANIVEAKQLISLVNHAQRRFTEIHNAWPEQATPIEVLRICEEALAFRHIEPVAKFLTKAEKLHMTVNQWQAIASREWSAESVYLELTSLIIHWRQLELSTWAVMLDAEKLRAAEDAKMWWFVAYENLIVNPTSLIESDEEELNIEDHTRQLLKTLEGFLINTTLGQFETRVRLLQQFQAHLAFLVTIEPEFEPVRGALANLINYFRQFVQPIQARITERRKSLEKDIQDVIKLASWKDRNVDSLRESSKASHRRLFKVVRKFRAILGEPVDSLIHTGLPDNSSYVEDFQVGLTASNTATADPLEDSSAHSACESELSALPSRFKNISATVSRMRDKSTWRNILDIPAHLDSFMRDTETSISQLRRATPAKLTEDNKAALKHLKTRKRKLFADVLREVRQMGFKSSLSTDILVEQDSMHKVFASVPPLPFESDQKMRPSQFHFLQFLGYMPKVRQASREHSEDITGAEITRSTAHLESMLNAVIRQRQAIAESLQDYAAITRVCDQVATLWQQGSCAVEPSKEARTNAFGLHQAIRWVPSMIEVAISVLQAQEKLGSLRFPEVCHSLADWRNRFLEVSVVMVQDLSPPQQLRSLSILEGEEMARAMLEEFRGYLDTFYRDQPQVAYLVDHMKPWTILSGDLLGSRGTEDNELAPDQIFEDLTSLSDQILAAVQDLEKAFFTVPSSTEDSQWLLKAEDALENCMSSLNAASLIPAWQSLLDSLHSLELDDLHRAAALVTVLLPILQQYRHIYQENLDRFFALHCATCRMSHILAKSFVQIATQGFCTPADTSGGQAEQMDKIEGGTGLGEGDAMEGAEDISKDMNGDEDLEELAQQPNDNQHGDEFEDEKDAVEMADELEGQIEQVEASDDEGGETEEAQEGSQQDIDSEIGSVDDLGASAVDEKVWDEAAEKDMENRKADDKGKGSKENDEQVAANNQQQGDLQHDEDMDDVMGEDAEVPDGQQPEEAELEHPHQEEKLDLPENLQIGQNGDDEELPSDSEAGMDFEDQASEAEQADNDAIDHDQKFEQDHESVSDGDGLSEADEDNKPDAGANPLDGDEEGEEARTPGKSARRFLGREECANLALDATNEQEHTMPNHNDTTATEDTFQGDEFGNDEARNGDEKEEPGTTVTEKNEGAGAADDEQVVSRPDGQLGHLPMHESGSQLPELQDITQENQAFKRFGDALERWYRQQRAIHESSKETQDATRQLTDQDTEMANTEFQHLQDNDEVHDTQALGSATEDEATAVDTSKAVDSLDYETLQDRPFEAEEEQDAEGGAEEDGEPVETTTPKEPTNSPYQPNALVGERTENFDAELDEDMHIDEDRDHEDQELIPDANTTLDSSQPSSGPLSLEQARALWSRCETATRILSLALTEHLRLILTPTRATKMRGDFRTGKRLNMKRIIPYVASQYKRDKIWMRRSVPSKRAYQIMLAIDDSSSMNESGGGQLALTTVTLISRALSMLEAGELSVVAFGETVQVAHDFETPFTGDAGAEVFKHFGFKQGKTNVRLLLQDSLTLFREARLRTSGSSSELWQLQIIISDGVCDDHLGIKRLVRKAQEERIMILFVIVDAAAKGKNEGIMELQKADFVPDEKGEMKVELRRYLDTFPFQYYLIVRDVVELPGVLAGALRQWFTEVVDIGS
ncbi:MAG: hypothetical protein Q9157_004900 [Trypethelium eluteriae]